MNEMGLSTRALKNAFFSAMDKTFGNITASAKAAGISRTVVYKWKDKDPKFKERLESSSYEDALLDAVDAKLNKLAINEENPQVLMFIAKTKGRKRGYIERSELSGPDGKDLIPARILTKEEAKEYLTKLENDC
jgi:propanediol dehydratase small subunit